MKTKLHYRILVFILLLFLPKISYSQCAPIEVNLGNDTTLCEEDEMIIFDDEPIIENDALFYMDTIQAELSKETRVCNEPTSSRATRYLKYFLNHRLQEEL